MLLMQNQIFRFEKKSVAHLIITMLIINVVGEVCHTFFNALEKTAKSRKAAVTISPIFSAPSPGLRKSDRCTLVPNLLRRPIFLAPIAGNQCCLLYTS